jgi:hypothetical protein
LRRRDAEPGTPIDRELGIERLLKFPVCSTKCEASAHGAIVIGRKELRHTDGRSKLKFDFHANPTLPPPRKCDKQ